MSYEKQTWATGDTITAAKLNHIEDGIADGGINVIPITMTEDGDNVVVSTEAIFADVLNVIRVNPVIFKISYGSQIIYSFGAVDYDAEHPDYAAIIITLVYWDGSIYWGSDEIYFQSVATNVDDIPGLEDDLSGPGTAL